MIDNPQYSKALDYAKANPTMSQRQIAARFGISQPSLHRLISNGSVPQSNVRYGRHDHHRDEVLAQYHSGSKISALTKQYGIHHDTIQRWIDEVPQAHAEQQAPIVLTVLEPIKDWEDSGEIIHMGNLGRVLSAMYYQSEDDDYE